MKRHVENGTFGTRIDASTDWRIARDALKDAHKHRDAHSVGLRRLMDEGPQGADAELLQDWVNQIKALEVARDHLITLYDEQLQLYFDESGGTAAPTIAEMNAFEEKFAKATFAYSQQEVRVVDSSARATSGIQKN